jgi:hypothetical protein
VDRAPPTPNISDGSHTSCSAGTCRMPLPVRTNLRGSLCDRQRSSRQHARFTDLRTDNDRCRARHAEASSAATVLPFRDPNAQDPSRVPHQKRVGRSRRRSRRMIGHPSAADDRALSISAVSGSSTRQAIVPAVPGADRYADICHRLLVDARGVQTTRSRLRLSRSRSPDSLTLKSMNPCADIRAQWL